MLVDYGASTVRLEDEGTAPDRPVGGVEVPTRPRRSGPSVDLAVDLSLPSGRSVSVKVDRGANR